MSDKTVTEREAVMRERKAFVAGCGWRYDKMLEVLPTKDALKLRLVDDTKAKQAAQHYPLPRVTRPREIVDNDGDSWRVVGGCAQYRFAGSNVWHYHKDTANFVERYLDLFYNPTEEVEDDA